ncbi:Ni/Fe hydrogenase subunit alpha [Anaerotardibacter muris]|uniref:Ni/Fe hydrogenase subunit alpha n=1 Tax=Anaerotardibacter muris TaxID=2941505 RepID=UPI00203E14BA|nr:Ni/Fe hydrogenase subunit alpha [Anaerotardibacter muris]
MTKSLLNIDHIARVEGHGNVHVVIENDQVKTVEMNIVEPARLFESMVRGHSYKDCSYIASRICGICSPSHCITDLKAVEDAFGVEVSDRTKLIRELLVYGSYLQNHASHLFVFVVPDFIGQPSVFPLAESDPELFAQALELKKLGNDLCTSVGGRSIHPITAVVGGFTHEISADEYLSFTRRMEEMIPFAKATVDLFSSFRITDIHTASDMLAMVEEDYYPVQSSNQLELLDEGVVFDAHDFEDYLEEYEVPHSGSLFTREKGSGKAVFTSALSRLNASWDHLSQEAKFASAKAGLRPEERNPMKNNLAQAIEILDALIRCSGICRELAKFEGSSKPVPYQVKAGVGVGMTEAPRGVVFHKLEFDADGKVVHASIITPTAQNLASLENDTRHLAEVLVESGLGEEHIRSEIAKLVRAYDPCLSCSVH